MKEAFTRPRAVYALLIVIVIALGLLSRSKSASSFLPFFIGAYAGDILYAMMVFFGLGFLFPQLATWRVAIFAFSGSVLIECSQLYHAPWLEALRRTRLGGLILGFGFLWSDLVCYAVGVACGVALEWKLGQRRISP